MREIKRKLSYGQRLTLIRRALTEPVADVAADYKITTAAVYATLKRHPDIVDDLKQKMMDAEVSAIQNGGTE